MSNVVIQGLETNLARVPTDLCVLGAPPGSATQAWCFGNHTTLQPQVPVIRAQPTNATISFNDATIFSILTGKKLTTDAPGGIIRLSSPFDPTPDNPDCSRAWTADQVNSCRSNVGLVPLEQAANIQSYCAKPDAMCYPCREGVSPVVAPPDSVITINGKKYLPYICPSSTSTRYVLLSNQILEHPDTNDLITQPKQADLRYRIDFVGDGRWYPHSNEEWGGGTIDPEKSTVEQGYLRGGESKMVMLKLGEILTVCSMMVTNCAGKDTTVQFCSFPRTLINMTRLPPMMANPPDQPLRQACTYYGVSFAEMNIHDYALGLVTLNGEFRCTSRVVTSKQELQCNNFDIQVFKIGIPGGPPTMKVGPNAFDKERGSTAERNCSLAFAGQCNKGDYLQFVTNQQLGKPAFPAQTKDNFCKLPMCQALIPNDRVITRVLE